MWGKHYCDCSCCSDDVWGWTTNSLQVKASGNLNCPKHGFNCLSGNLRFLTLTLSKDFCSNDEILLFTTSLHEYAHKQWRRVDERDGNLAFVPFHCQSQVHLVITHTEGQAPAATEMDNIDPTRSHFSLNSNPWACMFSSLQQTFPMLQHRSAALLD